jgi:hypothetical protein
MHAIDRIHSVLYRRVTATSDLSYLDTTSIKSGFEFPMVSDAFHFSLTPLHRNPANQNATRRAPARLCNRNHTDNRFDFRRGRPRIFHTSWPWTSALFNYTAVSLLDKSEQLFPPETLYTPVHNPRTWSSTTRVSANVRSSVTHAYDDGNIRAPEITAQLPTVATSNRLNGLT